MVAKKAKEHKKTKVKANKESDEEFLKRITKIREDASKKASEEINSYSKETEEFRATGRKAAKDLEEMEECEKIEEEFKVNPPVIISKHINGISVEYRYEDKFKTKIGKLQKLHGFTFLSITKNTSINSPTFTTSGKTYVKRRGQRILLPKSAIPPLDSGMGMGSRLLNPSDSIFVLENGDVIETEKDGYVTINDIRSNDKYHREIFVYPNSEVSLILDKKESHPEPAFMDPSKVPEVIKMNSTSTVIDYNFVAISLVKGIFQVDFLDEDKNVNQFVKLPSNYPDIEFLGSSKMVENIQDKIIAKMPVNISAMYKARMQSKPQKVCGHISAFIELCENNSIVIFGTANSVKNKSSGKIASPNLPKILPKDFIITGKITVANDKIYSDVSDEIDPRARAIMKNKIDVSQYNLLLANKRENEQKLKELRDKKSKPIVIETEASKRDKEKRKAELREQLDYYKKAGDSDMAASTQMQLDEFEPPKQPDWTAEKKELRETIARYRQEGVENQYRKEGVERRIAGLQMQLDMMEARNDKERWTVEENFALTFLKWCDEDIAKLKPNLNTNFPRYNMLKATDEV